jgi:large subunit ribosomal protein L17
MAQGKVGRKLGRNMGHRKNLLNNLVKSLFDYEQIKTTTAKAKECRRVAEKMITLAKKGTLASRREALRVIRDKRINKKLVDVIAPRYKERKGGYTKIYLLGPRQGDGAFEVILKLV